MDMETSKTENINNKEEMEEEKEKNKGCSNTATGTLVHVTVNNNLAAVAAKYRAAQDAIKQYPNTCKYFEPTQS